MSADRGGSGFGSMAAAELLWEAHLDRLEAGELPPVVPVLPPLPLYLADRATAVHAELERLAALAEQRRAALGAELAQLAARRPRPDAVGSPVYLDTLG